MTFLGQKRHFWALKLQVLKPFWPSKCIFSLNFPCEGTLGGLQHAIHRVGGIIGKKCIYKVKIASKSGIPEPRNAAFDQKRAVFAPITNRNPV